MSVPKLIVMRRGDKESRVYVGNGVKNWTGDILKCLWYKIGQKVSVRKEVVTK